MLASMTAPRLTSSTSSAYKTDAFTSSTSRDRSTDDPVDAGSVTMAILSGTPAIRRFARRARFFELTGPRLAGCVLRPPIPARTRLAQRYLCPAPVGWGGHRSAGRSRGPSEAVLDGLVDLAAGPAGEEFPKLGRVGQRPTEGAPPANGPGSERSHAHLDMSYTPPESPSGSLQPAEGSLHRCYLGR